jgi:hypothetical protein
MPHVPIALTIESAIAMNPDMSSIERKPSLMFRAAIRVNFVTFSKTTILVLINLLKNPPPICKELKILNVSSTF